MCPWNLTDGTVRRSGGRDRRASYELIADQLRGVVMRCAVVWEDAVKFVGIGGYLCGQVLCNALVSFAPPFSSWRDGMDKSGGVVSPSTMGRAGVFMR